MAFRLAGGCCVCVAFAVGCEMNEKTKDSRSERGFTVRLERSGDAGAGPSETAARPSRPLAFEMTGFAAQSNSKATNEQRAATMQAAAMDAFIKAVVEARRTRGEKTADFTVKFGPRLTVTHRAIGEGYEAQVTLVARGVETTFVVRNGVLMHPPHELRALRQVFDETGGEYALLGAAWRPTPGGYEAAVACYQPSVSESKLAGDLSNRTDAGP